MREIQSLARGLRILDMLADATRGVTITEVAAALEIDKSSASRLVQTLVKYNYARQEGQSRRYYLGQRLEAMGWRLLNQLPLRDVSQQFLVTLMQRSGESAHVAVYAQQQALVVADVEATASLKVSEGTGRLIPLHCTAVGKSLLAFTQVPFPDKLIRKTPHTITDPQHLYAHLEQIRGVGYAVDDQEHELGVRCIAAPVFDHSQAAIATIGISGPAVRITQERVPVLANLVVGVSAELSGALGWRKFA